MVQYFFEYRIRLRQYFVVPESQHLETFVFQTSSTIRIVFLALLMLTAIGFDDELRFNADKVNDETCYWPLATEFPAVQSSVS